MTEQGVGSDYQYARNYTGEEEDPFSDGFNHYGVADRMVHSKTQRHQPQTSPPLQPVLPMNLQCMPLWTRARRKGLRRKQVMYF